MQLCWVLPEQYEIYKKNCIKFFFVNIFFLVLEKKYQVHHIARSQMSARISFNQSEYYSESDQEKDMSQLLKV